MFERLIIVNGCFFFFFLLLFFRFIVCTLRFISIFQFSAPFFNVIYLMELCVNKKSKALYFSLHELARGLLLSDFQSSMSNLEAFKLKGGARSSNVQREGFLECEGDEGMEGGCENPKGKVRESANLVQVSSRNVPCQWRAFVLGSCMSTRSPGAARASFVYVCVLIPIALVCVCVFSAGPLSN